MLEGIGSMISLQKLTQLLISDPSKEPFVLIEKKPLPTKEEKSVNSSVRSTRIATMKRAKCFGLKYSILASTTHTFTDLLNPPGQSRVVNRNMEITALSSLLYENKIKVFSATMGFSFQLSVKI